MIWVGDWQLQVQVDVWKQNCILFSCKALHSAYHNQKHCWVLTFLENHNNIMISFFIYNDNNNNNKLLLKLYLINSEWKLLFALLGLFKNVGLNVPKWSCKLWIQGILFKSSELSLHDHLIIFPILLCIYKYINKSYICFVNLKDLINI